jgi:hypothetical protein
MTTNIIDFLDLLNMASQNEKDAYQKLSDDIRKIIGTSDKPKPKPPKFDAFGNPWNSSDNSYVSSAGFNNFSAASYVGCCGSYTCSVVPSA